MTPFFVGQCLYYAHGNVSIVKNAVHITAVYAGFFAAFFHALHPVGSAICQLYQWRLMFPGGNRCLSHMNLIAGKFQSGKCGKIPVTFSYFPRVCVRIFPASGSCRCRSVPYHAAVRVANSHPLRAIAAESHEGAVPYHAGVVPRRALCAPRQLYPAHEKLLRNERIERFA